MDERLKKAEDALHRAQKDLLEVEEALHGGDIPSAPPAQAVPVKGKQMDTVGKWRVEFDRENCIGAGACVAANADFWSIDQDGKANLAQAAYDVEKKRWILYLENEQQLQKQRDAAGVCPVNVIHIISPDGKQEL